MSNAHTDIVASYLSLVKVVRASTYDSFRKTFILTLTLTEMLFNSNYNLKLMAAFLSHHQTAVEYWQNHFVCNLLSEYVPMELLVFR